MHVYMYIFINMICKYLHITKMYICTHIWIFASDSLCWSLTYSLPSLLSPLLILPIHQFEMYHLFVYFWEHIKTHILCVHINICVYTKAQQTRTCGLATSFVYKVLFKHSHKDLFTYYPWLLLLYNSTVNLL